MLTIVANDPKEAYNEYLAAHENEHDYCCTFISGASQNEKNNLFKKISSLLQKITSKT